MFLKSLRFYSVIQGEQLIHNKLAKALSPTNLKVVDISGKLDILFINISNL